MCHDKPSKEAMFTDLNGNLFIVPAGGVARVRRAFGIERDKFPDARCRLILSNFHDQFVQEDIVRVKAALGWEDAPCPNKHDGIDRLFGVPEIARDDFPTECSCGAPLTYAEKVRLDPHMLPPLGGALVLSGIVEVRQFPGFPDIHQVQTLPAISPVAGQSAGCPFRHDDIDRLVGVPPMPVEELPKVCTCGAPITYADAVMFVSAPEGPKPVPGVLEVEGIPITDVCSAAACPKTEEKTLKSRLKDWKDFDAAAYELGVILGIFPEWDAQDNTPPTDGWGGTKHVFWTRNPLGNALGDALDAFVEAGILETDEEGQYRWNQSFDWQETAARKTD